MGGVGASPNVVGGTLVVTGDGIVAQATGEFVVAVGRRLSDVLPWVDGARQLAVEGVIGAEVVQHQGYEATLQVIDGGAANIELRHMAEPSAVLVRRAKADDDPHELDEILSKLPVAVVVSHRGRIVLANRAMGRLLGRSSATDLVGCGLEDILAPEEREAAISYRDRFLRGERVEPRTWRAIRADGSSVLVEGLGVRTIRYHGTRSVLWMLRDVTQIQNLQAHLAQADRLASIGTLAAGVAHELNNPLSFVCASVDYLDELLCRLMPQIPLIERRDLAELMGELRMGTDRVRKVVAELKLLSRTDVESLLPLEVEKIVDLAIRMTHTETRHRAQVVREYGPCPRVRADESRLGQVFLNLLVNASQALPEGHAREHEIRIRIGTTTDGWASIEVSDTGPGIPRDALEHLFEPFFTTKPVGVGTGLGLAICRKTVEHLGGRILATNLPPGGACFRILLPPCDEPLPTVGAKSLQAASPVRRHRILVIDDDVAVGRAVMRALARDHHVEFVPDPKRALALLENG